jgi:outer membrane immunogenic protein
LITGQVGSAWIAVLWYVKGGAAVTDSKYSRFESAGGCLIDSASATHWGGAICTGVDVGFAPNWSIDVAYDHLFIGTSTINMTMPTCVSSPTNRVKQDTDLATVRVNDRWGGLSFQSISLHQQQGLQRKAGLARAFRWLASPACCCLLLPVLT